MFGMIGMGIVVLMILFVFGLFFGLFFLIIVGVGIGGVVGVYIV